MTVPGRQPRLAALKSTLISVPLSGNKQLLVDPGCKSLLATHNGPLAFSNLPLPIGLN